MASQRWFMVPIVRIFHCGDITQDKSSLGRVQWYSCNGLNLSFRLILFSVSIVPCQARILHQCAQKFMFHAYIQAYF